jgi:hypothetical protein
MYVVETRHTLLTVRGTLLGVSVNFRAFFDKLNVQNRSSVIDEQ